MDCSRVKFTFTLPTPWYTKCSPALRFIQEECISMFNFHHDFYTLHPSQSLQFDACINENRNMTMLLSSDSRLANAKHKMINKPETFQQWSFWFVSGWCLVPVLTGALAFWLQISVVFLSSSQLMPSKYLDLVMIASSQIFFNRSFTRHPTVHRDAVCDTRGLTK